MKQIKVLLPKIGLSVLSLVIIATGLEIFFRYRAHHTYTKGIRALHETEININSYEGEIRLRHIIRLSNNPRIIYELIPRLRVNFLGKPLRTNPDGFRSPPYAKEKTSGIMRIIGLGDSFMFGWGVSNKECYLSLLENKFQMDRPDLTWEVINTAVPGYNTVMEVETLQAKGLSFQPDIVVIHFVGNDTDLPNFIQKKENIWSLRESFLAGFLRERLQALPGGIRDPLVPAPHHRFENRFENDPKRVSDEYRNMVGKEAWIQAMNELKALSLKHDFDLFMVLFQAPDFVKETCSRLKIPIIETYQKIKHTMDSLGILQYEGSILTISKEDPHPSELGHVLIADCIFEYLRDSDLIPANSKRKMNLGSYEEQEDEKQKEFY